MQVAQNEGIVTLEEGMTLMASGRSLNGLSKKMTENTKYRLFFPVVKTEMGKSLTVGTVVGRSMNRDLIGKGFVTYEQEEYNYDTLKKQYEDLTEIRTLSSVCRIIRQANYLKELAEVEESLTRDANKLGKQLDPVALKAAVDEIKLKYEGNDAVSPKVPPTVEQTVRSLNAMIFTEALVVPLTDAGAPELNKMEVVTVPLSRKKMEEIAAIYRDDLYKDVHDEYIEASYNYMGTTKAECGRNASIQPIAGSVSLKVTHPDAWVQIEKKLPEIARRSDIILSHTFQVSASVSTSMAIALIKKYISTQAVALVYMDMESEDVRKNAKFLMDLDIVKSSPVLSSKVESLLEEEGAAETGSALEEEFKETGESISYDPSAVTDLDKLPENVGIADLDELEGLE